MYGDDIDSLHIDIVRPSDGVVTAQDILIINGEQQSDENEGWKTVTVNLELTTRTAFRPFSAPEFQVRIRAVAAGNFRGDIAIDNVIITNRDGRR